MHSTTSTLLALTLLCVVQTVALAQGSAPVETIPCPLTLPQDGEVEGETYECHAVTVPENHETPGERTVDLVVMRLHARTLSPMPDPLVYLSGGPGGSALHEITGNPILYDNMEEIRARRDVLVYDQRGTGHSQLLACGPYFAAAGVVGETSDIVALETLEAALETAPSAFVLIACAGGLEATGVDLAQYNSVASSRDIAALVGALGYESGYNLYGTSYGTRLALNAMRSTPEGVRSVVLDGTVTPDTPNNAYTVSKISEHYDGVFAACAADDFCGAAFPDLRERFIAVIADLNENPLLLEPPLVPIAPLRPRVGGIMDRIDPAFFAIFGKMNNDYLHGGYAVWLPQIVEALETRDEARLRFILGDPEAPALPQAADLPAPEETPAAQDIFTAPSVSLILAIAAQDLDAEDAGLPQDFMAVVIDDLAARLGSGEAEAEVIRSLVELSVVPLGGIGKAELESYVAENLTGEAQATASAFLAEMTRQDVRATMWAIQDVAEVMSGAGERTGTGIAMGTMFAINCPEDITFVPEQVAEDFLAASPYPGLIVQSVETYGHYRKTCEFFASPFTEEEMMSPVESDIPTLIFQSALDTQTPLSLGRRALETLANGQLIEWGSEGHVVAGHSPDGCAGAIAASFIEAPMQAPDAGCASSDPYRIPFAFGAEMLERQAED